MGVRRVCWSRMLSRDDRAGCGISLVNWLADVLNSLMHSTLPEVAPDFLCVLTTLCVYSMHCVSIAAML